MCGRFTLRAPPQALAQEFDLFDWPQTQARYNVAPTQQVPIVRLRADGSGREAALLRWGLIPFWSKDVKIGNRMINARADGIATKPAFRAAIKQRRCLVPTDGFFEWQKGTTPKQPFLIHLASGKPFALAGLWERWVAKSDGEKGRKGEGEKGRQGDTETGRQGDEVVIESFTIITTEANDIVRALHDRMPVILETKDYEAWLNPGNPQLVEGLLKPFVAEPLVLTRVDPWVNSPRHDDPRCVRPLAP